MAMVLAYAISGNSCLRFDNVQLRCQTPVWLVRFSNVDSGSLIRSPFYECRGRVTRRRHRVGYKCLQIETATPGRQAHRFLPQKMSQARKLRL